MHSWTPKSILLLRHDSRTAILADLIAGVTVGLVALSLAKTCAISSGVSPQAGLYCGPPRQPARLTPEFHEHVGAENICPNIDAALQRAAAGHAIAA